VEAKAVGRFIRVPTRKARLVVDMIRGREVAQALSTVRFTKKTAARAVEKVLRSAVANAQHTLGLKDVERLVVGQAFVDEGPTVKRIQPRAMGRSFPIRHRTSHITIVLRDRPA